jgi:putative salt-induced outer membrane protein YdiY
MLCISTLMLTAIDAQAEWSGGVEGGTVIQDAGNATRLRLKLTNNDRPLSHYIYADWLQSGGGGDSYSVGYNPRYWLSQSLYLLGEARVRVVKPLAIDRESLLILGVGNQFIASGEQSLWAEIGAGQRATRFEDNSDSNETIALARAGYFQIIAEQLRLELDVNALQGEEIGEIDAEAGIAWRLGTGAVKYSYRTRRIKVDGLPAVTDSDSFVSFTYGF